MIEIQKLNKSEFEKIVYCRDDKVGLNAIIALHDTTLGPGTGGCRFYPYKTEEEALTDVMRLSRGMTYKSAVARLNFGGGKAVIIGDPKKIKTPVLLKRFAEFVNDLGGRYITAKDVGINGRDLTTMSEVTPHILGIEGKADSSGDPSIATAYGIMQGIRAIAKELLNKDSLKDLTFAIQGVGYVGYYLAKDLHEEGAKVIVTDVDQKAIDRCKALSEEVSIVKPNEIYDQACDFFVPCAMGGVLNSDTIPKLKCKFVAGAANNQLASLASGYQLAKRNIFYAPDYVINAGGIINIAEEQLGYDKKRAFDHISGIYQTMVEIIQRSKKENEQPFLVADKIGKEILDSAKKKEYKAKIEKPSFHDSLVSDSNNRLSP